MADPKNTRTRTGTTDDKFRLLGPTGCSQARESHPRNICCLKITQEMACLNKDKSSNQAVNKPYLIRSHLRSAILKMFTPRATARLDWT